MIFFQLVIGIICLTIGLLNFILTFVPPIIPGETLHSNLKISALFLIGAAISFHG